MNNFQIKTAYAVHLLIKMHILYLNHTAILEKNWVFRRQLYKRSNTYSMLTLLVLANLVMFLTRSMSKIKKKLHS